MAASPCHVCLLPPFLDGSFCARRDISHFGAYDQVMALTSAETGMRLNMPLSHATPGMLKLQLLTRGIKKPATSRRVNKRHAPIEWEGRRVRHCTRCQGKLQPFRYLWAIIEEVTDRNRRIKGLTSVNEQCCFNCNHSNYGKRGIWRK